MNQNTTRLSRPAFEELKAIVKDEIESPMTDVEIEDMGVRLLHLFDILRQQKSEPKQIRATELELNAVKFLNEEIDAGRNPSIRALAKAMDFRSSRSGFRLLQRLIGKGLLYRDTNGMLRRAYASM